jgi:DNA-binding LacI/PurR family transcriptional regulator
VSDKRDVVSLRTVAERVGLAACSVSAILNNTPASHAIPQKTKDRVFRAVRELNYRPNLWARSLRTKRTRMVAAITSDIGHAPVARVLAGLQHVLHRRGYLLALEAFDCTSGWNSISVQLQQRGIEGVVAIDATLPPQLTLPIASVNLDYMTLLEPLAGDMRTWLSELGESAGETILRQIEQEAIPRRTKIAPKLPSAYFGLPSAPLAVDGDTRESA